MAKIHLVTYELGFSNTDKQSLFNTYKLCVLKWPFGNLTNRSLLPCSSKGDLPYLNKLSEEFAYHV